MEYYTPVQKKDELLSFVTTWIKLEGIMLSKVSQNENNQMISFIHGIERSQTKELIKQTLEI